MKKMFLLTVVFFIAANLLAQNLFVKNLQCQHKTNPVGIDNTAPELSWQLEATQRGVVQTAYQIIIADNITLLQKNNGNIWNSKKIKTATATQILFKGKKLIAEKKYFWKVQVWDNKGNAAWSETANFTTALFAASDWSNAAWIGYEALPDSLITVPGVHSPDIKKKLGPNKLKQRSIVPLFRKRFTASKSISNATVYISGLGHYELSINGEKIGNSF